MSVGEGGFVGLTKSTDSLKISPDWNPVLQGFSEERVRDLMQRIWIGDIDGLAEITGLDKKKTLQAVRRYNETAVGIDERRIFRTPDARKLKQEILSLFAEQASSRLTKNKLLLTAPSLDKETIQKRLTLCTTGKEILIELKKYGKLENLRNMLLEVSFEKSTGKSTQRNESDTLQYFVSRMPIMKAGMAILTEFEECQALKSFWKGVERDALGLVIKTLEQLGASGVVDPEAILSDAEVLINEMLQKGRIDQEKVRSIVEDQIAEVIEMLKVNAEEENQLRKAAFEGLSIPFEFDRVGKKKLIEGWKERKRTESATRQAKSEAFFKGRWKMIEDIVERIILLDQILAIALVMEKYFLVMPKIGDDGVGFVNGTNIFLRKEQFEGRIKEVQPVSYSLGKMRSMNIAKPRNVVMLTGANSGGKTTLLTTLAVVHILTLLGLPVPCDEAEVAPMPIYLYRRRVTRRIGSLEQALRTLIPTFADRHRKLVLMDEFEALTEPGASGRIVAAIINAVAAGSSLLLIVTHLARETLPHVKLPIRIDGIEATGLNKEGELVVDRQPLFNHIGSSTPKLIIMKLSKAARKKSVKSLYNDVLNSLESEKLPIQTPLALPWIEGAE